MTETLRHRGPDDAGVWTDPSSGVALGHRRLAILDLTPTGKQPMISECSRFVMTYNGEVYNFQQLREELENLGHKFRGQSDTEVVLAAISEWGIETALPRMNGMFAFAVWDRERHLLTLARDRVGKKPLYYGWCGDVFVFGSELKALRAHPDFDPEIDRDALGLFLKYSWIPAPYSIYKQVRKLPAGTSLTITRESVSAEAAPQIYWSPQRVAEEGARDPYSGSLEEATAGLDTLLRDAVSCRMVADVSLGALLSGGIDSTTVVSIMQAMSSRPVKTFTVGFREPDFNEADHAKAIARHLGTDHTELYVTPEDALAVIPSLPFIYDEPFADRSQIPTFVISRLARGEVTVALSGDGGDELFVGYPRYARALQRWTKYGPIPLWLRRTEAHAIHAIAQASWHLLGPAQSLGPTQIPKWHTLGARLERRAEWIGARSPLDLFAKMRARCEKPGDFVCDAQDVSIILTNQQAWPQVTDPIQGMLCIDFATNLVDDILVKVDRASMAVSLEVRCPLLDYRVVEFAWRLPLSMRLKDDGGKSILRNVLQRYVPLELTERPKMGFGVPIAAWIRGPLRDWAEGLLDERQIREHGLLRSDAVRRIWQQHLTGWQDHDNLLWNLLMFQAWHDANA